MRNVVLHIENPSFHVVNPGRREIEQAFRSLDFSTCRIGDVMMTSRDWDTDLVHEVLFCFLPDKKGFAILQSPDSDHRLITQGSDHEGTELLVEDSGGVDWKLNTRFLLPFKELLNLAFELSEGFHPKDTSSWAQLPSIF